MVRIAVALFVAGAALIAAGCGGSPLTSADARDCEADLAVAEDVHVVQFDAVPDLSAAYGMADWEARGRYVVSALQATARESQREALGMIEEAGICIHRTTVQWISNALVIVGPAELAGRIAQLPGVTGVVSEDVPVFEPSSYAPAAPPVEPPWGVAMTAAPDAWSAGSTGRGVTIGVVDTGVAWRHPALITRYRGFRGAGTAADHDRNWWSPLDRFRDQPTSTSPHGTHVTGIAVGGTGRPGGAPIGIAPGATFIAALACTADACPLAGVMSALQFMIAPTDRHGRHPDPSARPQIVSNSWQRSAEEVPLERAVTALEAAGVLPVFAVGNGGPACGTALTPGTDDDLLMSVGAVDRSARVARFSGRGPARDGGPDPDVVAPGVHVVSSIPGGRYAISQGTSMAAPAVAGMAALVMQANPALRGQVREVASIIRRTARPVGGGRCGTSDGGRRNNTGGYGMVDAAAAARAAAGGRDVEKTEGRAPVDARDG